MADWQILLFIDLCWLDPELDDGVKRRGVAVVDVPLADLVCEAKVWLASELIEVLELYISDLLAAPPAPAPAVPGLSPVSEL